jgi:hypothetical protein
MRFVATVLLAVTVVGGARAIHPPMGPTPGSSDTGDTDTQVHITSTTGAVQTPEPSGVTLALIGLLGGSTYRLVRRKA